MISCTRRLHFCAGHRVLGHESKCSNAHGHNYVALFEADADLDSLGRVIDFSVLKEAIGGWIDEHWDHAFLVNAEDHQLTAALGPLGKTFTCNFNPTAERMAEFLLREICPLVLKGKSVRVTKVTLWETENCFAEARL